MAEYLDAIPDFADSEWVQSTPLARLEYLHYRVLSVLVDLAVGADADVEQGWLNTFGNQLSAQEVTLLHRVVTTAERLETVRVWWDLQVKLSTNDEPATSDSSDEPEVTHPLLLLADAYRETILDLLRKPQTTREDGETRSVEDDGE